MSTGLLPADDANVGVLRDVARRLMAISDDTEELGKRLAYEAASLAVLQASVHLQQQARASYAQPQFKPEQRPWNSAGKRAFGKAYGNGTRG